MEEPTFQGSAGRYYTHTGTSRRSPKKFIVLLVILLVLGVVLFRVVSGFIGVTTDEKSQVTPTPIQEVVFPTDTPTPTPETSPTPTSKPTPTVKPTVKPSGSTVDTVSGIDRATITVNVQNGSGTAGAGSKASSTLQGLGYKIGTVGNADNFNYQTTSLYVKTGKTSLLNLLASDLASSYTIGTKSATLAASSSADALVIVGKQ